VVPGDHDVRHGTWRTRRGRELGSIRVGVVGVVGAGRIGRGVLRLMSALGTEIRCSDPYLSAADAAEIGVTVVGPRELAATGDVVSLHAPGGQVIVDDGWLDAARPAGRGSFS